MKDFFNQDRLRTIFSVALSFLVCLGVFGTVICIDLLVISNPSFVIRSAEKSNYTEVAAEQLTEELNYLSVPSGLPEDFFTGKIDKLQFNDLFFEVTKNTISANKSYKLDLKDFNSQVLNSVTEYSKNESGDYNEEVEKDIALFANECENIYLSYVNPSIVSYVLTLLVSVRKYSVLALIISVVFTFISGFVLFKMNRVSKFTNYCIASLGGAALTAGIIPFILILTNEISRISISSKSLYVIITTFATGALWVLLASAAVLAVTSLVIAAYKIFTLIFGK